MYTTDQFITHLKEDTKKHKINWSQVGSFGSESYSIDFRPINPVLDQWTQQVYLTGNWSNMFVADIKTGFVYIAKSRNIANSYSLYIQTDCYSKIIQCKADPKQIASLYSVVSKKIRKYESILIDFMESYIISHWENS